MKVSEFLDIWKSELAKGGYVVHNSIPKADSGQSLLLFLNIKNIMATLSLPQGSVYSKEGSLELIMLTPYSLGENDTMINLNQVYDNIDEVIDYIIKNKAISNFINTDVITITPFESMDEFNFVLSRIEFEFII